MPAHRSSWFSGDKLLGGPQAGVLGVEPTRRRVRRHPLYRALRPGGLVLGALEQVALAYLERDGDRIPFWRKATASVEGGCGRGPRHSAGGGGWSRRVGHRRRHVAWHRDPLAALALDGDHTAALRTAVPRPVIARVDNDRTILDLRTVDPDDDALLASALP